MEGTLLYINQPAGGKGHLCPQKWTPNHEYIQYQTKVSDKGVFILIRGNGLVGEPPTVTTIGVRSIQSLSFGYSNVWGVQMSKWSKVNGS